MKKTYMSPQVTVVEMEYDLLLAVSGEMGRGKEEEGFAEVRDRDFVMEDIWN